MELQDDAISITHSTVVNSLAMTVIVTTIILALQSGTLQVQIIDLPTDTSGVHHINLIVVVVTTTSKAVQSQSVMLVVMNPN